MKNHRFGRKLNLPSTMAIKHQLLTMSLEEEIAAVPAGSVFDQDKSSSLASLRKLLHTTRAGFRATSQREAP